MKTLFKLIFLLLFTQGVIAQSNPSDPPLIKSLRWARYAWVQADSGMIVSVRDTNWTPRFAGTMVLWQQAGVDTANYSWDGRAWIKVGEGTGGTMTNLTATDANGFTWTITNPTTTPNLSINLQDAAADGTTKGKSTFTANDFNAIAGLISIDYTNGQIVNGSQNGFVTSSLFNTWNAKESALTFTSPLSRATNTISITNAAANASTKGAATFVAKDFNDNGSGTISIDYVNGDTVNATRNGFLSKYDYARLIAADSIVIFNEGASGINIARAGVSGDTLYFPKFNAGANITLTKEADSSLTIATIGSGILSLNGLNATSQTFATPGTSGTAPNWSSTSSTHTLNIPHTSATNIGLVNLTTRQKMGLGLKVFDSISINQTSPPPSTMLYVEKTGSNTEAIGWFKSTGTIDALLRMESNSRAFAIDVGGSAGTIPGSFAIRDLNAAANRLLISPSGGVTVPALAGASSLVYADAVGTVFKATIGTGLSFVGGTLNATGGASSLDSSYMNSFIIEDTTGNPRNDQSSGVELDNGTVLVAYGYFFGPGGTEDDDSCKIALKRSYNQGRTWGDQTFVNVPAGKLSIMVPSLYKRSDDTLLLVVIVKHTGTTSGFYLYKSGDDGVTWTSPQDITPAGGFAYIEKASDRIIRTKTGKLFFPWDYNTNGDLSGATGNYYLRGLESSDNGATWTTTSGLQVQTPDSLAAEGGAYMDNDSVYVYFRGRSGWVYYVSGTHSLTGWSPIQNTGLNAISSVATIKRLNNDSIYLAAFSPRWGSDVLSYTSRKFMDLYVSNNGKYWVKAHRLSGDTAGTFYLEPNITLLSNSYVLVQYSVMGDAPNFNIQLRTAKLNVNKFDFIVGRLNVPFMQVKAKHSARDTLIANFTTNAYVTDRFGSLQIVNSSRDSMKFTGTIRGEDYSTRTGILLEGVLQADNTATTNITGGVVINSHTLAGGTLSVHPLFGVSSNGAAQAFSVWHNRITSVQQHLFGTTASYDPSYLGQFMKTGGITYVGIVNNDAAANANYIVFEKKRSGAQPNGGDIVGEIYGNGGVAGWRMQANSESSGGIQNIDQLWYVRSASSVVTLMHFNAAQKSINMGQGKLFVGDAVIDPSFNFQLVQSTGYTYHVIGNTTASSTYNDLRIIKSQAGSYTAPGNGEILMDMSFNTGIAGWKVVFNSESNGSFRNVDYQWYLRSGSTIANRMTLSGAGDLTIPTGGLSQVRTRGATSGDVALLLEDNSGNDILKVTGDSKSRFDGQVGFSAAANATGAGVNVGVKDYASSTTTSLSFNSGTSNDAITAGSGTIAELAVVRIGQTTRTSTNASVTHTVDASLLIDAAPLASTNTTITNAWALYVKEGKSHFGDEVWVLQRYNAQSGDFAVKIDNANVIQGMTFTSSWAEATLNLNPTGSDVVIAGRGVVGGFKNNGKLVEGYHLDANDADFTVGVNHHFIELSATLTAGRNIVLPAAEAGRVLVIWIVNSSGNVWTFTGRTVVDGAGATVTSPTNDKVYTIRDNGTNYVVQSIGP